MPASSWDLGNTIRSARIKKGYTQEYLAEILDITPSHLKMMEGGRRNPSVPLLFQMMELLDFSVDALVFPERSVGQALHTDGLTERGPSPAHRRHARTKIRPHGFPETVRSYLFALFAYL